MSGFAAWQMKGTDTYVTVGPAEIPAPKDDEVIVKTRAIAINPVDWLIQAQGTTIFPYLQYPLIGGYDVAGVVHAVGAKVTRFQIGDRVLGLSCREAERPGSHKYEGRAFSTHAFVPQALTASIPPTLDFKDAAVLPMGLSVAATGLFERDYLGLQLPQVPAATVRDEWLLITAGASSVGACAIQLAVSAGYNVVTTSSPHNFALVKQLGAAHVLDYHRRSDELVEELVSFFAGKKLTGAYCVGSITDREASIGQMAAAVVQRVATNKFVAFASAVPSSMPDGVDHAFVWGTALTYTAIGQAIFADFVPRALQSGQLHPLPHAVVVGHGLGAVQTGLDRCKKGVSAQKIVVTL